MRHPGGQLAGGCHLGEGPGARDCCWGPWDTQLPSGGSATGGVRLKLTTAPGQPQMIRHYCGDIKL